MMDKALLHDKCMSNMALDITADEHKRCTEFMMQLEGKATYDYVDAMVLMPIIPKVNNASIMLINQFKFQIALYKTM